MKTLEIKGVVIPDGYLRIYVKELSDIPEDSEEESIVYIDPVGDGYCFFEGGVYVYTIGELE